MFRNYLVTALRNIVRHKLYSVINIAGLAVGMACVIFVLLFVRDELSFDKWLPGSDNLYRVDTAAQLPGMPRGKVALAPLPLPALMKDHLPDVTEMTRLWPMQLTVQVGDRQFLDRVNEADPNFFTMLGLPLVAGGPAQVLQRPDSIVLSQSLARKYFGTIDAVGRTVAVTRSCDAKTPCADEMVSLLVTGVMRDVPYNTQFAVDAVIPIVSPANRITDDDKKGWFHFNGYGYVRLAPGSDPAAVEAKLRPVMDAFTDVSVGIRKVFGARTRDVVVLLLWQFSIPVLIANVIAWPLAWYYLHGWLQGFAYRVPLSPFYFIATGLMALLIAWATIFAHAHRVARANPIHALRTE